MKKETKITLTTSKEKLFLEIKTSLYVLNDIACYQIQDKEIRNSILRELRKINNRINKY